MCVTQYNDLGFNFLTKWFTPGLFSWTLRYLQELEILFCSHLVWHLNQKILIGLLCVKIWKANQKTISVSAWTLLVLLMLRVFKILSGIALFQTKWSRFLSVHLRLCLRYGGFWTSVLVFIGCSKQWCGVEVSPTLKSPYSGIYKCCGRISAVLYRRLFNRTISDVVGFLGEAELVTWLTCLVWSLWYLLLWNFGLIKLTKHTSYGTPWNNTNTFGFDRYVHFIK